MIKDKKIFISLLSLILIWVFFINSSSNLNIFEAAKKGDLAIIKELIELKVDLDLKNEEGETALMIACKNNHLDIVKLLIEAKANFNLQSDLCKSTPLMFATYKNHVDIVQFLISVNANLDVKNSGGCTILWTALFRRYPDIIKLLINEEFEGKLQKIIKSKIHIRNPHFSDIFEDYDNTLHLLARLLSDCNEKKNRIVLLKFFLLILASNRAQISHYNKEGKTPLDINPKVIIYLFTESIGNSESYLSRIKNLNDKIIEAGKNINIKEVVTLSKKMDEINLDKNWLDYLSLDEDKSEDKASKK